MTVLLTWWQMQHQHGCSRRFSGCGRLFGCCQFVRCLFDTTLAAAPTPRVRRFERSGARCRQPGLRGAGPIQGAQRADQPRERRLGGRRSRGPDAAGGAGQGENLAGEELVPGAARRRAGEILFPIWLHVFHHVSPAVRDRRYDRDIIQLRGARAHCREAQSAARKMAQDCKGNLGRPRRCPGNGSGGREGLSRLRRVQWLKFPLGVGAIGAMMMRRVPHGLRLQGDSGAS